MAATIAGGNNTFVPNPEATGGLQIEFARNAKDFALPNYVKYIPVKKTTGLWLEIGREQAARVSSTGYDLAWQDAADAPTGNDNHESFEYKAYTTKRHAVPWRQGYLALDQAEWDVWGMYDRLSAQRAMTLRTVQALTLAQTTGSWPTAHTIDVTTISGVTGKWNVSTVARTDIKRSLDYAIEQIILSTNGVAKEEDLQLVMGIGTAKKISECQEVIDYMKGSSVSLQRLRGEGSNVEFTLPNQLYNIPIVVERTVRVTSKANATRAASFVMDEAKPMLVCRPGGLVGTEGVPEFSTLSLFIYEKDDMTVETYDDERNRVRHGRIVDNFVPKVTAGVSGFLFQNVV